MTCAKPEAKCSLRSPTASQIERSEAPCPGGTRVYIGMLRTQCLIDTAGGAGGGGKELGNHKMCEKKNHRSVVCVRAKSGLLAKYFKASRRKTKGKWISESGAVVPDEVTPRAPTRLFLVTTEMKASDLGRP